GEGEIQGAAVTSGAGFWLPQLLAAADDTYERNKPGARPKRHTGDLHAHYPRVYDFLTSLAGLSNASADQSPVAPELSDEAAACSPRLCARRRTWRNLRWAKPRARPAGTAEVRRNGSLSSSLMRSGHRATSGSGSM